MEPVIGIDLGTSNTVVACMRDGQPSTLPDEEGNVLIPSVVSMPEPGQVLVGYPAKERRFLDPLNTVLGAKRLVGRAWTDPALQEARRRLPFELRRGPNESVRVMLQGELFTLPEISAFVLRKARSVAEQALGVEVARAVITVPANFNELQRQATKLAGALAGLDVVQVLNEPTSAALAYGYGKDASERVAVFDLGGGTFDLTLLTLFEQVLRVRATTGDMFLGGEDIDTLIASAMAETIARRHYHDPRSHGRGFDQLRSAAERLKFMLSVRDNATVDIPTGIRDRAGYELREPFTMRRAELDALASPIVDRALALCEQAFKKLGVAPSQFDRVVLVGGSTRMPIVRERVAEFFGREAEEGVNPDEAVALGAAIRGLVYADEARGAPPVRPEARDIDVSVDLGPSEDSFPFTPARSPFSVTAAMSRAPRPPLPREEPVTPPKLAAAPPVTSAWSSGPVLTPPAARPRPLSTQGAPEAAMPGPPPQGAPRALPPQQGAYQAWPPQNAPQAVPPQTPPSAQAPLSPQGAREVPLPLQSLPPQPQLAVPSSSAKAWFVAGAVAVLVGFLAIAIVAWRLLAHRH